MCTLRLTFHVDVFQYRFGWLYIGWRIIGRYRLIVFHQFVVCRKYFVSVYFRVSWLFARVNLLIWSKSFQEFEKNGLQEANFLVTQSAETNNSLVNWICHICFLAQLLQLKPFCLHRLTSFPECHTTVLQSSSLTLIFLISSAMNYFQVIPAFLLPLSLATVLSLYAES